MSLVLTSGGLGPTADDMTAEVVGRFQRREMIIDSALQERIAEIVRPLAKRWPNIDQEAIVAANRKQATIPEGATVLEPVGTAPGLVVPPITPGGGPDRRRPARPAARAAADVAGRRRGRRAARRAQGSGPSTTSARCGCSGSPSRRSPRRCGSPIGRGSSSARWRSRPA